MKAQPKAHPLPSPPAEPLALYRPRIQGGSAVYLAAIAALTLLAATLRAMRLDHPMRYDEAFSYLFFAARSDPRHWLSYLAPNNHVLHTILEHFFIRAAELLGLADAATGAPPAVLRMPAYLAGVALVPATARLAVMLDGRRLAGVLAATLVGASSILIEYSVNARGYSMLALASVALGIFTLQILRDARPQTPWTLWAAAAALGAFTVPVMLYPAALLAGLLALQIAWSPAATGHRRMLFTRLAVMLLTMAAVTLLLYLPVIFISGPGKLLANEFVVPQPMSVVLAGLPTAAARTLHHWTRDTSPLWMTLLGGGLGACLGRAWKRHSAVALVPLAGPVLLAATAILHRVVPFPRVWLFLLPLLLACAAAGLAWLAAAISPRRWPWLGAVVCGVLLVIAAGHEAGAAMNRTYMISEEPNTLVDAEQIIRDVAPMSDGHTTLIAWVPGWPSLGYYSMFHAPNGWLAADDPQCHRAIIVVAPAQTLQQVLTNTPYPRDRFAPPQPWREYPRAKVYLAQKNAHRP